MKALREAKVAHQLAEPGRGVRSGGRSVRASAILDRRRARRSCSVRAVPGARRGARHLQQPGAAADQDHGARRSRFLSGHRAVGSDPRRSRQSASRRLRRGAADCWRRAAERRRRRRCSAHSRARRPRQAVRHDPRAGGARALREVFERATTCRCRPPARGATRCSRSRGVAATALAITCVPRLVASLMPDGPAPPVGDEVWADTRSSCPPTLADGTFRDVVHGRDRRADGE